MHTFELVVQSAGGLWVLGDWVMFVMPILIQNFSQPQLNSLVCHVISSSIVFAKDVEVVYLVDGVE